MSFPFNEVLWVLLLTLKCLVVFNILYSSVVYIHSWVSIDQGVFVYCVSDVEKGHTTQFGVTGMCHYQCLLDPDYAVYLGKLWFVDNAPGDQ